MSVNRHRLTPIKQSALKTSQKPKDRFESPFTTIKEQYCTDVNSMTDCTSGCLTINNTVPKCSFQPEVFQQQQQPQQQTAITPWALDYRTLTMDDVVSYLGGKVIEVEGNIGCGKSTLTKLMTLIMNNHKNGIFDEVTVASLNKQDTTTTEIMQMGENRAKDAFALVHGELVNQTFLSSFYANPVKYGFAFQMYMLTTRLYQMQTAAQQAHHNGQCAFLDRGAVGDALFALYNASTGSISQEELNVYKSVCRDRLPPSLSNKVDVVAYLDVSPVESFRRMNSMRQRDAEKEVVPDYIEGIDHAYFELMIKWMGRRADACGGIDVGKPPAMVMLDWSTFGCSKTVLQKLARAAMSVDYYKQQVLANPHQDEKELYKHIIQPSVTFVHGNGDGQQVEANAVVVDTAEQVDFFYNQLHTHGALLHPQTQAKVDKLYINWALPHNNEFRRLSMKHVAAEGAIVYYNSDHEALM